LCDKDFGNILTQFIQLWFLFYFFKNSVSFPTGQTITPTGMAIMPSNHLYGHTGLLHSAMPIFTTATNTTGGHLITAGVTPTHPGYTAGNNVCFVYQKLCKYNTQTLIFPALFLIIWQPHYGMCMCVHMYLCTVEIP